MNEHELRAWLDKRNERARAKRRAETDEEKQKRLEKINERDRARRREESTHDKNIRLGKRKLVSSEQNPEKRAARLEDMSELQKMHLETETAEQRGRNVSIHFK